jgi:hypothetical protein
MNDKQRIYNFILSEPELLSWLMGYGLKLDVLIEIAVDFREGVVGNLIKGV